MSVVCEDTIHGVVCPHKKSPEKIGAFLVTALGFKPKTFSSVVRCSIQLSYAAIPLAEAVRGCKYTMVCEIAKKNV